MYNLLHTYLGEVENVNLPLEDRAEAWGLCLEIAAQSELEGHPLDPPLPAHPDLDEAAIAQLAPESLGDAADAVARLLESALANQTDLDEAASLLEDLLLVRHRVLTRTSHLAVVPEPLVRATEYFDELLHPLVWAMAFANPVREGHATMIARENRGRAWWWCDALDVEWSTVERAFEVVLLAARFPAFDRHVQAMHGPARALNAARSHL